MLIRRTLFVMNLFYFILISLFFKNNEATEQKQIPPVLLGYSVFKVYNRVVDWQNSVEYLCHLFCLLFQSHFQLQTLLYFNRDYFCQLRLQMNVSAKSAVCCDLYSNGGS